jgi:hypothetical protein
LKGLSARRRARAIADRGLARLGLRLASLAPEVDPYLRHAADTSAALPPDAAERLRDDHPRLLELRAAYARVDWPVVTHSRWQAGHVDWWLDLRYFRADNPYVWHYRESERSSQLKYFVFLRYVHDHAPAGLVDRLEEDGLFGCWTYEYPGYPACSRDLLDSVNEIAFLQRHLGVLERSDLRVIDVGAGYGRMAHRMSQAVGGLRDYCCVDAVPESTFLSEFYVAFRGLGPTARVVALPDVPAIPAGGFDLALNIHSFSECPHAAIEWWMGELRRLDVSRLFLVPNERDGYLSTEPDGSRRDYLPLIEGAGYRLAVEEPAFTDPAVRELLQVDDRHCLFERTR